MHDDVSETNRKKNVAMTNLHSTTELTEFGPLSPDVKQTGVSSMFSKFFKFSEGESTVNFFSTLRIYDTQTSDIFQTIRAERNLKLVLLVHRL